MKGGLVIHICFTVCSLILTKADGQWINDLQKAITSDEAKSTMRAGWNPRQSAILQNRCIRQFSTCNTDIECLLAGDCCQKTFFRFLRNVHTTNVSTQTLYNTIVLKENTTRIGGLSSLFSEAHCLRINNKSDVMIFEANDTMCPSERLQKLCNNRFPAPVSIDSNIYPFQVVFKNMACARCHGIRGYDVKQWNVTAQCDVEINVNHSSHESVDHVLTEISLGSHHCQLQYDAPPTTAAHRKCNIYYSSTIEDENELSVNVDCFYCKHYISPYYQFGNYYKNEHCFRCEKSVTSLPLDFRPHVAASLCASNVWLEGVGTDQNMMLGGGPTAMKQPIKYQYNYNLGLLFELDVIEDIEEADITEIHKFLHNASANNSSRFGNHSFKHDQHLSSFAIRVEMNIDVFSIIVVSISCICLFVLILVYFFVPKLRNFHGKTKMSFSVALFFAQLNFLLGSVKSISQSACQAIAYSAHYFWVSSFLWSSVMAFDIATRFGFCFSFSHRMGVSKSNRRFLVYSFIAWVCPLVVVVTAALVDAFGNRKLMGYGLYHVCWITHTDGLMYAFAYPVFGSTCFNLICFVSAIFGIENHRCALQQSTDSIKQRRVHCLAYTRVSLLLGACWAFAFLAAWVDSYVLSTISIAMNGLQGFFMLLSSVCSVKGRKYMKRKVVWLQTINSRSLSLTSQPT